MKKQFANEIGIGESVDDVFALSEKTLMQKKDGNPYINITLSDKTGNIKGVVWDNVDRISANISSSEFVQARGKATEYRDAPQIVLTDMIDCPVDSIDPSDFLPVTRRNIESMFDRLLKLTASMETGHLRELLESFWDDVEFANQYKVAPAAAKMHHAYIGGLLEHSLSMALLAERIAGHYGGIDRDLLVVGTILHDIGKIREFEYRYKIGYSDEGRLVSHIVIGLQILDEKISKADNFPKECALLLKHLIVSHHGTREFGSPEPPKTIEAVLLNYIDEIDSKVNGIREFMATESPDETWTSFHRMLGRHLYIGKKAGALVD